MEEHYVRPEIKARYYTLGELGSDTKEIWIVCHGYGQLAQYFIKKFEPISSSDIFIVAPEGLSKFYLEGFSGKIGATWMTRENRLIEIENYIAYLNSIYSKITSIIDPSVKIVVFGFSQGVATTCRWVLHQNHRIDHLVMWAGEFPADIDPLKASDKLSRLNSTIVYGTKDPFLSDSRIQGQLERISALNHKPGLIEFDGAHDIPAHALVNLKQRLMSDSL